jgi:hypothetical protein
MPATTAGIFYEKHRDNFITFITCRNFSRNTTRAFPFFTEFFLARESKLRYNEIAEESCQSESEAKICTEKLTGTR